MDPVTVGIIGFACILLLLAVRVPIAFAMAGISVICTFFFYAMRTGTFMPERAIRPTVSLIHGNTFDLIHSYELSMIPLFVFLGHIAFRTGMTSDIYAAARLWLARIPGGVAMASVIGCGGFSAITGSSIACASAMGRICAPEMLRIGYDPRLATSSVAVGGTLGSLIPPSVLFIIYGIFTETSINQLFLAGVLPGLLTLFGFLLVIFVWVYRDPAAGPAPKDEVKAEERKKALLHTWPALLLFVIIIGGIYGGLFTATEAAAISVAVTLLISLFRKAISMRDFLESIKETCIQTSQIFFIAAGAKMFVGFIALTGMSGDLVSLIDPQTTPVWVFLLALVAIYIALGMFLDPLGIMVLTLPFMVPMVELYGLDLIWFGVVVIKLLEIGLITPPVGLNVFVIGNVIDHKVPVSKIFSGVTKFLIMDIIVLALIVIFPIISLLMPTTMQ